MRFHVEREIDAPAETVWNLLTNGGGYTGWNPTIISLDGTIAEGETIALVSTLNPKRTFKLKVSEVAAPTRMVWADGMPLGLFTGARTYLIDETKTEERMVCSFSMTEEYSGLLAPLITKTIPDMTESFEQFADGLKAAAEGGKGSA